MAFKIFVIAGEESGDRLAGAIISALIERMGQPVEIRGIGGESLRATGLMSSLVPMSVLSVMGVTEIVPKIPFFLRTIARTVLDIESFQPDLVLTVDSPDFCFRVQSRLRQRGKIRPKQIHVVAPSVWAWRPSRAKKIARFLDGLICLLPFEPPYFEKYGLPAVAIGHPIISSPLRLEDGREFRAALGLGLRDVLVGVYPGSREGVVKRHAPIFAQAITQLAKTYPKLQIVVPTFPRFEAILRTAFADLAASTHIVTDPAQKLAAMRANNIALAASGTVGLELAVANVPHVVAYRTGWINRILIRILVHTPFAHLANIALNRRVVPELLHGDCTPGKLAAALGELINYPGRAAKQQMEFAQVRQLMGEGDAISPAVRAAEFILERSKQ